MEPDVFVLVHECVDVSGLRDGPPALAGLTERHGKLHEVHKAEVRSPRSMPPM